MCSPRLVLLACVLCLPLISGYVRKPGPKFVPTVGYPWPMPKNWKRSDSVYSLKAVEFSFRVVDQTCDILESAIHRYKTIVHRTKRPRSHWRRNSRRRDYENSIPIESVGEISSLAIHLEEPCEKLPYFAMNETYELTVDDHPLLISKSIWGILRGLETFSQLIYSGINDTLFINKTSIIDSPRFPHRGLLVDTSRHFIHPKTLHKILDGMSYNKLNVFHWHIVDDESFPYVSNKFPELSQKAAYDTKLVYSQRDVAEIIEYARLRGIRVMVEFDTPGHTRALGESHPEVLAKCYGQLAGYMGPVDPTKNSTYDFMRDLFQELVEVFPEQYIHLGADEVEYECWQTNPDISRYIKDKGINYNQLQSEYIEKILEIVTNLNASSIVWQEAFQSGLKLNQDTIVQVWISGGSQALMADITRAGHKALLSAGWYLDHLQFSSDFANMYQNEPTNFAGSAKQKELVIGGEACMWSEMVDNNSIQARIFPRVSAAAERLWSWPPFDVAKAQNRIEEHACRIKRRGISTQPPNGPGFCLT